MLDHLVRRDTCPYCTVGGVDLFILASGKPYLRCNECDAMWCDFREITLDSMAGHLDHDGQVFCGHSIELNSTRFAVALDVVDLGGTHPIWEVVPVGGQTQIGSPGPESFVVDHSGYVLSVGGCSACDQDRVLAWVSVSGRLVFRCPDGHEATSDSEGRVFPLWWVPDSEDPRVAVERYANAGDIAAIIAAGGPRSGNDDELHLADVKWAILPRPEVDSS